MPGQAGAGTTDRCKSHPQVEWQSGFQFLSHKRMRKDRYSSRLGGLSFHRAKLLMICITVATLFMPCLGCDQGEKDDGTGNCEDCTGGQYQDETGHTYTECKECGPGQVAAYATIIYGHQRGHQRHHQHRSEARRIQLTRCLRTSCTAVNFDYEEIADPVPDRKYLQVNTVPYA